MTTDSPAAPNDAPSRPRRRGVYLLPNLFTTAVLFSGFYAIVAATDGNFDRAGIAIFNREERPYLLEPQIQHRPSLGVHNIRGIDRIVCTSRQGFQD